MKRLSIFILPLLLFSILIISSCSEETTTTVGYREITDATIFPDHGSMFGNYPMTITAPILQNKTVLEIKVGENTMYKFQQKGDTIIGYTQGSPNSGPADIIIKTEDGTYLVKDAFTFDPLKYPALEKMVAVGASYTQGWISMGLNIDYQLNSPFSQLARHIGAYFPNGLVKPGILDGIPPSAYVRSCTITSLLDPVARKIFDAMKLLEQQGKDKFYLAEYRYDPGIMPHNLGIGGDTISDTVEGPSRGRMPILNVFAHLSYDPYVNLIDAMTEPPTGGPFETAMSLQPTILFSTDLFADDILYFAPMSLTPTTDRITPVEDVRRELEKMFSILAENNVEAFIANLPRITVMPIFKLFKNFYIALGYSREEVDRWERDVASIAAQYSTVFTEVASRYPNIHIVDFRGLIDEIMDENQTHQFAGVTLGNGGIEVNGNFYSIDFLGGLVSLDAIHLTYTGYALIANMFIDALNRDLKYDIPYIDMEKVIASDPLTPQKLEEMGVNLDRCREEFFDINF